MHTALVLLAQAQQGAPENTAPGWAPFLPLLIVLALFLIIMVPGARRERERRRQLLENIKKNVDVVTDSGIVGTIVAVNDEKGEVTLRSEDTKFRVLKSRIAYIVPPKGAADAPAKGA
jgi:preprotein translocase YajC subunit